MKLRGWVAAVALACVSVPLAIAQSPMKTPGNDEQYIPQLGDLMNSAQTRHIKLWLAGKAANWPLAAFELDRLKVSLVQAALLYSGIPVTSGKFLAKVSREDLARIFAGNIPMPMLDEKLTVLHDVGAVLAAKYEGRFANFVHSCSPRLYDNGNGLVDRLVKEFPRFNDVSTLDGH